VVDAVGVSEDDGGVDGVVALAEDLGGDDEILADDRLRGTRATVDERRDVDDRDPPDREDP